LICQFCGRKIKSLASIKRQAGHTCFMRDRQQLKLDLRIEKESLTEKPKDAIIKE